MHAEGQGGEGKKIAGSTSAAFVGLLMAEAPSAVLAVERVLLALALPLYQRMLPRSARSRGAGRTPRAPLRCSTPFPTSVSMEVNKFLPQIGLRDRFFLPKFNYCCCTSSEIGTANLSLSDHFCPLRRNFLTKLCQGACVCIPTSEMPTGNFSLPFSISTKYH